MNVKIACLVVCLGSLVMGITDEELDKMKTEADKRIVYVQRDVYSKAYNNYWNVFPEFLDFSDKGHEEKKVFAQSINDNIKFQIMEVAKAARDQAQLMYFAKTNTTLIDCIDKVEKKLLEESDQYVSTIISEMQKEKDDTKRQERIYLGAWKDEFDNSFWGLERVAQAAIEEIYRTKIPAYIKSIVENFERLAKETEAVVYKLDAKLLKYGMDLEKYEFRTVDNYKVLFRLKGDEAEKNIEKCF